MIRSYFLRWELNFFINVLLDIFSSLSGFFKENFRFPVRICRDPISLVLVTRFSLILGMR